MSNALNLLNDLAEIGATIRPAGDRLILRAGQTAIPAGLVQRVREAKLVLLALLPAGAHRGNLQRKEATGSHQTFRNDERAARTGETCIVAWLNQHPAPSAPGRCGWCGRPESADAMVLPFGTEPGTHAWLHAECWPDWHRARLAAAAQVLRGRETCRSVRMHPGG